DLDVAIDHAGDGDAGAFAEAVAARLTRRGQPPPVVTGEKRFGTASVVVNGHRLDIARLRRERYAEPGALPRVSFVHRIEDDLGRRDFSVNAIALGLAGERRGELVDPFGGLDDLTARRLRVLHDRSFIDDATRL